MARKGQFQKGVVQPGAGRPKGCPNKATTGLRNFVKDFLEENKERLLADFEAVDPNQRLIFWEKMLAYVLPKPVAEKEAPDKVEGIELRIVYPDGRVETKKD